jgi:hypothetical protein
VLLIFGMYADCVARIEKAGECKIERSFSGSVAAFQSKSMALKQTVLIEQDEIMMSLGCH